MASDPVRDARSGSDPADGPNDDVVLSGGEHLLGPGGKVDQDALRRVIDEAPDDSDDSELRRVRFEIRRDLKKRLDKYLTDRIAFMSRTQLQRLVNDGGVLVNARLPKASTVLRARDVVEVVIPAPPATNIQPENIPLDVLFEDEYLIVLNKHAGIIVHPARSHLKGTMLSALAYHFLHTSRAGGALSTVGHDFARPGVVHRLDRHTSGVIVFAKCDEAHWKLAHEFEHRRVEKRYLAVVHGLVEPDADVIDLPLGPHQSREKGYREKYVVRHDALGKASVTVFRVRERYRLPGNRTPVPPVSDRYSLVELELRTGRTHQIRVHLSHLGWPIIGDDMYGGRPFPDVSGRVVIERQALHAALLSFNHPITGERHTFTAPLRGDLADLVRTLRAESTCESVATPGTMIDMEYALGGGG